MTKRKRKLTPAEKAEKKRRREEYETIFIGGKQKRVKREPTIDGLPVYEFYRRNADVILLHQNEMWELIDLEEKPIASQQDGSGDTEVESILPADTAHADNGPVPW